MSNYQLANRYAKSIFELSQSNKNLDDVRSDVRHLRSLINESAELRNVLNSPILNSKAKGSILNEVVKDMKDEVKGVITILVAKNRTSALAEIADRFENMYNEFHGVANATVISAVELDAKSLDKVKELLASHIEAKKIVLTNEVDPSIIGGMVVRYKDQLLDMSVSSQINKIRKELILN